MVDFFGGGGEEEDISARERSADFDGEYSVRSLFLGGGFRG